MAVGSPRLAASRDRESKVGRAVSSIALIVCTVSTALVHTVSLHILSGPAIAGLLVYLLREGRCFGIAARILCAAAAGAGVAAVFLAPAPSQILLEALDRTAYFATLLTALAVLREAALRSPLMEEAGASLLHHPSSLRYLVISLGGQLAAVILNFGVMPLLGGAILGTRDAAQREKEPLGESRRRMCLALLRGFATMTMWSPLSLSFAVTFASVGTVKWQSLMLVGLGTAVLMSLFGFVWDIVRHDRKDRAESNPMHQASRMEMAPLLRLAGVVTVIVCLAWLVSWSLGVSLIDAVILTVPVIGIFWVMVQELPTKSLAALPRGFAYLSQNLAVSLPAQRNEVAIIGGTAFIGAIVAALMPERAAAFLLNFGLPPIMVVVIMCWSVIAAGAIGIGPLIMVTVLGSTFSDPAQYGISPIVLGVALMGGWGLAVGSSPVAAGIITLAGMARVPARVIGQRWNGGYTVCGALLLAGWLVVLDYSLGHWW